LRPDRVRRGRTDGRPIMAIAMTIMPPACQAFRVCNLPEGVKQVGFRNSPDINDRCGGGSLFEALDGSVQVAMNQTDEWIQVAESRWLPKKYLVEVDPQMVADMVEETTVMDALTTVTTVHRPKK
jgi:hypothetical protein